MDDGGLHGKGGASGRHEGDCDEDGWGEHDRMDLIRPNGLVERLSRTRQPAVRFDGYGRTQPGPAAPEDLQAAAARDRRRRRRSRPDPLRGRLLDVEA